MNYYFSPTTKGFYPSDVDYGDKLPSDVVLISEEEYKQALIANYSDNKAITGDNGRLTLVERGPVPVDWESVRYRRNKLLSESDYTQMADWKGNKEAWSAYRQALRDIPENFEDPNEVIWPEAPDSE